MNEPTACYSCGATTETGSYYCRRCVAYAQHRSPVAAGVASGIGTAYTNGWGQSSEETVQLRPVQPQYQQPVASPTASPVHQAQAQVWQRRPAWSLLLGMAIMVLALGWCSLNAAAGAYILTAAGLAVAIGGATLAAAVKVMRVWHPEASAAGQAAPPAYIGWSVLAATLGFFPLGVAAIVYAAQVRPLFAAGDYHGASRASHRAGAFAAWALLLSLIAVGTVVGLVVYLSQGGA